MSQQIISLIFGFLVGASVAGSILGRLHRKQFQFERELHEMTVAQLKQSIADARTAIQQTVVTETAEVKALIQGNAGGATPAQLDEIGGDVQALQADAIAAIQSISDGAAGDPNTPPTPGDPKP